MKGGKNNDNFILMPYHYKGTFLWEPAPAVTYLVLRQIGEAVHKHTNRLRVFYFP